MVDTPSVNRQGAMLRIGSDDGMRAQRVPFPGQSVMEIRIA